LTFLERFYMILIIKKKLGKNLTTFFLDFHQIFDSPWAKLKIENY
jgi:hypothetical protein